MALLSSIVDPLCCQEDHWDALDDVSKDTHLPFLQQGYSGCYDEEAAEDSEHLGFLLSKEAGDHPYVSVDLAGDGPYMGSARTAALGWVARASAAQGFSALTVLLAAAYLDRCFLPASSGCVALRLQGDRPWMARLAAAACLSLAAKVEETRAPLLLDLQASAVEEGSLEAGSGSGGGGAWYLFEAKTVRRMELLVLSALGWRMNPVTPLSYIHLLLPKLIKEAMNNGTTTSFHESLRRCHAALLSVLSDRRWVRYRPSEWAVAAMWHAMGISAQTQHLIALLSITQERVEECYKIIVEIIGGGCNGFASHGVNKRKFDRLLHSSSNCCSHCSSTPPSPNGVIGTSLSFDSSSSSGDSWAMWPSSVSSSPEPHQHPLFKQPCCIAKSDGDEDNVDVY